MPHSESPESTLAGDATQTVSPDSTLAGDASHTAPSQPEDVPMSDAVDAPAAADPEKEKVDLEALFDDEDSDQEFPSSAPQIKAEEESSQPSQPAPMCAPPFTAGG